MFKLNKNALNLEIKRIVELSKRGKEISYDVNELCATYYFKSCSYTSYDILGRIEKGIALYKKKFNEDLTAEEQTLLGLFIIIPDDDKLIEQYIRANTKLKVIAQNYYVSEKFVAFRLKVQIKINNYNKIKRLIKEKKEEN